MIKRIYVESKPGIDAAKENLLRQIHDFLNIKSVQSLRIIKRYDVENISDEIFRKAIVNVFSEPPVDDYFMDLEISEDEKAFAVSYLPGQFDQRADSAAVCIQMLAQIEKPLVQYATVYILSGSVIQDAELQNIKDYLINPVDSHEVGLELPDTLKLNIGKVDFVPIIEGFIDYDETELKQYLSDNQCAMDLADLKMVQSYFASQKRNPTETELKVIDTYWSDHCRHTTFNTELTDIVIEDEQVRQTYDTYLDIKEKVAKDKPMTLMNMATIGLKHLKADGKLTQLDESDEINACTIKVKVDVDGREEDWLFLFKNETHNHPTEIEPFGGAATCIGGAIRDPLSGRSYVYAAMRVTGAANPLEPIEKTMKGKLPQRKIVTTAADGYSSYGNQIGLATSLVDEFYHPSYAAKRLEIGAVVGAAKAENVKREKPQPGDLILLVGGRTGRDGIGGATGSSKSHDLQSVSECGAQVQKGNAIEERKLQRLFRNPEVSIRIKKCNDFGAGGVCVAVGELADGLNIHLDNVKKKYEGLDATELAISESQERMAIVIDPKDREFIENACHAENIETTLVATVTAEPVLKMSFMGQEVVHIERYFLDTNGADKQANAIVKQGKQLPVRSADNLESGLKALVSDLNHCSKQGLIEQFDSTIGAYSVCMPLGGQHQKTPMQTMVNKMPVLGHETKTCSFMSYGFNPELAAVNPYQSAYQAVVDSICKIVASGCDVDQIHLTFQEYFPSLKNDAEKWGLPIASLLGALQAQLDCEAAAIGGKDSMSGTFEDLEVIPTLVSFAVSLGNVDDVISPEFKKAGNKIYLIRQDKISKDYLREVSSLIKEKKIISAYSLTGSSIAEALFKMSIGNRIGAKLIEKLELNDLFRNIPNGFLVESNEELNAELIGHTTEEFILSYRSETISLIGIQNIYDAVLEPVYSQKTNHQVEQIGLVQNEGERALYAGPKVEKPKVLIPVFPGTNCEYETERAWQKAGADTEVFLVRNLTVSDIEESIDQFAEKLKQTQILFIPGGFSGADEPDGSAKFITSFMRNQKVATEIDNLLNERQGLIGGICNGFQALIKLGLLPYGKIIEPNADMPTLTLNTIKRHQSRITRIKVCNTNSPWLSKTEKDKIYFVPISHGEGRIIGDVEMQNIATQYVDMEGNPSNAIEDCPNNSHLAIEGLISSNGRVFGKMGHSERISDNIYKNVVGDYDMKIFEAAVAYFVEK